MTDETGDIDTAPPADDVVDDAPEPSSAALPDDGTEGEATDAPNADDADPEGDEPKDLKDLRAKYPHAKNDKDLLKLLAPSHWSSAREGSKLAKERDELRARLAELEAQPATPAEPEEVPPDLKAIDDAIGALTTRLEAIPASRSKLIAEINKARLEVHDLERDLSATTEYEQGPIKAQIKAARLDLDSKMEKFQTLAEREESLQDQIKSKERDRKAAEREAGTAKARQQQAAQEAARIQKEFPARLDALADKAAAEVSKIPLDDNLKSALRNSSRRAVAVALWNNEQLPPSQQLPSDVIAETVVAEVSAEQIKFAEAYAKAAISDLSKRKAAPARVPSKPTAVNPSAAKPLADMNAGRSPVMADAAKRFNARVGGVRP